MSRPSEAHITPVHQWDVTIDDSFWSPYLERVRETMLDYQYDQLETSGCLENFRAAAGRGDAEFQGMWFVDTDAYKWIEAASYVLETGESAELRERVDEVVELIAEAQADDGYLDTWITLEYPDRRWTNLSMGHELYCAGHLIEAAVAHYRATGDERLLNVATAFADLIDDVFGPEGRTGTPGHEEVELALVRLFRVTDDERYLDLATFFVERRGRGDLEAEFENTEGRAGSEGMWDGTRGALFDGDEYDGSYAQDHAPVREQATTEGHSVRATYLYAAMADLVIETGDAELFAALSSLWENMTERRTYVTGGIGSTHEGERFTEDYHLPNETSYAETCASVGSIFWNHRMFQLTGEARFPELVERTLYNAFLAGVSLDLTEFFYANAHEVGPDGHALSATDDSRFSNERQGWFECACCPPNAARLLTSLGGYLYARSDEPAVYVNQFVGSEASLVVDDADVTLRQETSFPWDGDVTLTTDVDDPVEFALRVRVPEWSRDVSVSVDGASVPVDTSGDYLAVEREWADGDELALEFGMRPERLVAHPSVDDDRGKIALRRGPLVYCLEGVDHDRPLHHYAIDDESAIEVTRRPDLLRGVTTLEGTAAVPDREEWMDSLYRRAEDTSRTDATFTAIPCYAWANRTPGEMRVWLESA